MVKIRKSRERGHFDHGWLDTYHTFSFADYYDPNFMGFRSLRVINEDRVSPGQGFGTHSHRDMEIITYVLSGKLEHRDSMGNGDIVEPGQVQYMAAGTGVAHSEFNPSKTEPVHLMQIWITPSRKGLPPRYEQRQFPVLGRSEAMTLLASPEGISGSITINQDAMVYAGALKQGQSASFQLRPDRAAWMQVLRGTIELNTNELLAGDGAAITEETQIEISGTSEAEFLLFDLS